jgi:acetyltransferase-like isoleucine patch superfamily enzyme
VKGMNMTIKGFVNRIKLLKRIDIAKYIQLNYCNRNVIRSNGAKIIPYRGAHVEMAKSAKIILNANLRLNEYLIKGSKAECLVLLRSGSVWEVNGDTILYYGAGVQVHENGVLRNGNLYMNTGSLIICGFRITLGQTVSMARMAFIFDDDHHPIYNGNGERINEPKEITIGDNVWLGMKSTVLKGSDIGSQCVVGANSLIAMKVPPNTMVSAATARPVLKDIYWKH